MAHARWHSLESYPTRTLFTKGKPVPCVSAVRRADSSLESIRLIRNSSPLLQELGRCLEVESVVSVVGRERFTSQRRLCQKRILPEK